MLRALSDLKGYAIEASDGLIGHVEQVYFDDEKWAIRYLVVRAGTWFDTREVLLSPISLGETHWETRTLTVRLTKDKVKHSPPIELHKPVSQQEDQYNDYYGWSSYWGNVGLWARWGTPVMMATPPHPDDRNHLLRASGDRHLRSSAEVAGYHLHAIDDPIGHVEDFIIDDETWAIRYVVVNTSNWGLGRKVLIAPDWVVAVHADDESVDLLMTADVVKRSPTWEPGEPITPDYEAALADYYRQRRAWANQPGSNELPMANPPRG